MTLIEYAARCGADMKGLSRAWSIPHQSLKCYCIYLKGTRGKRTCARCPSPERQAEIERLSQGLITAADWPPYDPTQERDNERRDEAAD